MNQTADLNIAIPVPWRCAACTTDGSSVGRGEDLIEEIRRRHDELSPLCHKAHISLPLRHSAALELREMGYRV